MTTRSVQPADSGTDVHVLFVDGGFTDSIVSDLQRTGEQLTVETVSTASAGLEHVDRGEFDCVLSAYELPDTNGVEFLEAVRQIDPDLPFMLVTDSGSEAVASAAITAGVTDYVSTDAAADPPELLVDRIQTAVRQYRSNRAEQRMLELAEETNRLFYVFTGDWSEALFVSSAYEAVLGRPTRHLADDPTDFLQAIHPDDRELVREKMARLSAGEPTDVEVCVNEAEGYQRRMRVRGEPIVDDSGTVVRIAGFATDITEEYNRRQRRRRQQQTLVDLATDEAVTNGDLDRALQRITETAAAVLDVDRVNVWLAEENDEQLTCVDNYDRESGDHTDGMELATSEYPAYFEALETHRAIDAVDARSDPRTAELTDFLETHDIGALLDGTLRSEGAVVGVICHEHLGGPREWTDDEIEFVSDVADIVNRALRNHERTERERELRRERQQFEKVLDTSPVGITILDSDGTIQRANDRAEEIFELEASEIAGRTYDQPAWEIVDENGEPIPDEQLPFAQVIETGEPVYNVEHGIENGFGQQRWLAINAAPLSVADSEEWGVLAIIKDITERYQEAQTLKMLHERTQAMARTENREAIAGIAAETMDELLGFDGTVMYRFDGTDSLVPLEWSAAIDAALDERVAVTRDSGYLWSAFVEGEPVFFPERTDYDGQPADLPLQSAFVLPIGNHGVLLTGTSTPSTLSATKREAAHLIQETLDAALDRADREQRLRERDRALQRQNEQFEQLNRLNTIIRETTAAVIQSTSRSEIEQRVCERVAAGTEYSFAWIGDRNESTGQPELRQWAELDPEYAEYLGSGDGIAPLTEMVETAMRDGTVQVVQRILEQPMWKPHRRDVLNQAYRSVAVVPIVVRDHVESVLVIHGTAPDLFDEREQAVLGELGDAIGYAVANLNDGETLDDGRRTEIELLISDERLFSNQLATALGVDIEVAGAIAGESGTIRTFVRFPQRPEDAVDTALAELTFVVDSQRLTGTEETALYQITLETPRLVRSLRANGVRLRSLSVENEVTTVSTVLSGAVRPVVEAVQADYPQTELQARRDGTDPVDTQSTFRDRLLEDLTEKQFDALQTALYGGFYEWPRTSTREELAATRDIASSTFSHHLRAAERKVLSAVLDSV